MHLESYKLFKLRTMIKKLFTKGQPAPFFILFDQFLQSRQLASSTINNYNVLASALMRFFTKQKRERTVSPDKISANDISAFISFYSNEPLGEDGETKCRSRNTVAIMVRCLRTFFKWCQRQQVILQNPFDFACNQPSEHYATPFFLTINERDIIAQHDFSNDRFLAVQRDIFIFQCFTGCRISDLMHLTRRNISGNFLEYIARKTASRNPTVIRLPLHPHARSIINAYPPLTSSAPLLPFIASQRYNYAIKEILTQCSITRYVPTLCPYSGKPVLQPINKIASSHLARRTFIGNLYRKVKDPNLIGSLTGHVEGSHAFARYRTIDDEIKQEIIMLL